MALDLHTSEMRMCNCIKSPILSFCEGCFVVRMNKMPLQVQMHVLLLLTATKVYKILRDTECSLSLVLKGQGVQQHIYSVCVCRLTLHIFKFIYHIFYSLFSVLLIRI